ncbi:MAG: SPASM domain-containing protein [Saprospiraceae bacterium]|nr:SPASM domain-containing protein [Saprospiraceae bacterium]
MQLHFSDSIRFLSKLTFAKVWNIGLVTSSYYYSRLIGRPVQWGLPFTVSIEPTTACNLRCPECPSGLRQFTRSTGSLKADFFSSILDDIGDQLTYLIFYFQGEPYINPDFLSMVKHASDKGIYTITSTNGHFLDDVNAKRTVESGLDRLIISVDGATQDVYEQYRKTGNLESVLQGARNVVQWKKELKSHSPLIIFQCLVVRPNEDQLERIRTIANEIGVDQVVFKTAQVYDYQNGHPLIPLNEKYARYKKQKDGTYALKHRLLNHCWKLWHSCVVTWNGLVVPCCFDKDAKHQLGDLKNVSFLNIWNGPRYQIFREKLFAGRNQIDICTNCTEGCLVWRKK